MSHNKAVGTVVSTPTDCTIHISWSDHQPDLGILFFQNFQTASTAHLAFSPVGTEDDFQEAKVAGACI